MAEVEAGRKRGFGKGSGFGADHLADAAGADQGPVGRECGWLCEEEDESIARTGDGAKGIVAGRGLAGDTGERADVGGVAACERTAFRQGGVLGGECRPDGVVERVGSGHRC